MKHTKKALFASAISLLLCISMLIGTTFAWFTDSVTSGNNNIIAGNLDIELTHTSASVTEADDVAGETELFRDVNGDAILWEPGVVAWENLTVKNVGTLALKYQMAVNFLNENATTDGYKLSQILKVGVVAGGVQGTDRAAVVGAVAEWQDMAAFVKEGKLLPADSTLTVEGASKESETYGIVIYWEPSAEDNNWNLNNGKKTTDGANYLHVDLGINLVATQLEAESDSFGNDYDKNATYIEVWDGTAVRPVADENGVYHVTNASELAGINLLLRDRTAEGDVNVVLDADIDLGNLAWTPIGETLNHLVRYEGTFDGRGHTVYNVNVTVATAEDQGAGLFGHAVNAEIKNLNAENVTVNGGEWVGGLVGYALLADISNCTVTDGEINGDSKVAGIVGHLESGNLTNSAASGLMVVGNELVAGLAGRAFVSDAAASVVGNTVSDSYVVSSSGDAAFFVSDIRSGSVVEGNVQNNVTLAKAATVASSDDLSAALADPEVYVVTLAEDYEWDATAPVTIGAGVKKIIDLNENELNATGSQQLFNVDGGDLTLKNGDINLTSITGNITYDRGVYTNGGGIVVKNNGTLTVSDGVNVTASGTSYSTGYLYSSYGYVILNLKGTVNIEGGTFDLSNRVIGVDLKGNGNLNSITNSPAVNISGGTFKATDTAIVGSEYGTAHVTGGTFEVVATEGHAAYALFVWSWADKMPESRYSIDESAVSYTLTGDRAAVYTKDIGSPW